MSTHQGQDPKDESDEDDDPLAGLWTAPLSCGDEVKGRRKAAIKDPPTQQPQQHTPRARKVGRRSGAEPAAEAEGSPPVRGGEATWKSRQKQVQALQGARTLDQQSHFVCIAPLHVCVYLPNVFGDQYVMQSPCCLSVAMLSRGPDCPTRGNRILKQSGGSCACSARPHSEAARGCAQEGSECTYASEDSTDHSRFRP